jgi:hypothetical protein
VVYNSSSAEQNHCGHLVVDGSDKTYWESKPGNDNFITIDLSASDKLHKVIIHWGANYGTEYRVLALQSNNDIGTEIFSTTQGDGGIVSIDPLEIEAQFIKIYVSKVKDPIRGCVITEVEIMGDGKDRFIPSTVTALDDGKLSLNKKIWRIQNAMFVQDNPETIANPQYDDTKWIPASVSGTVMGSYYDFGALPDPLYGDNMHQISDEFFSGNNFFLVSYFGQFPFYSGQ